MRENVLFSFSTVKVSFATFRAPRSMLFNQITAQVVHSTDGWFKNQQNMFHKLPSITREEPTVAMPWALPVMRLI